MAFMQSLSAAIAAAAVTRRCSSGELTECGCDETAANPVNDDRRPVQRNNLASSASVTGGGTTLHWSGCSDNIDFGVAFSSAFVDFQRQSRDAQFLNKQQAVKLYLVNLHNGNAGRKVILTIIIINSKKLYQMFTAMVEYDT